MTSSHRLFLYEEIMLLALKDQKGTLVTSYVRFALAGALLAELLLEGRIAVDDSRRKMVNLLDAASIDDPILDQCMKRMAASPKRAPLKTWVTRLARTKGLRHQVARRLCGRGILRSDEDNVLLVFTRRIYPTVNSLPKKEIVERMRAAIMSDVAEVDPRTTVLISLARGAQLLGKVLGRGALKGRRDRIKQIVQGEAMGKATREVIEACEAAVFVAAIVPGATAGSHH